MAHHIDKISFEGENVILKVNYRKYRIPTALISMRLMRAEQKERETIRFSPAGYTIRWPLLQLEMSVSGLMQMATSSWL